MKLFNGAPTVPISKGQWTIVEVICSGVVSRFGLKLGRFRAHRQILLAVQVR
jgi:hypothetical protein